MSWALQTGRLPVLRNCAYAAGAFRSDLSSEDLAETAPSSQGAADDAEAEQRCQPKRRAVEKLKVKKPTEDLAGTATLTAGQVPHLLAHLSAAPRQSSGTCVS